MPVTPATHEYRDGRLVELPPERAAELEAQWSAEEARRAAEAAALAAVLYRRQRAVAYRDQMGVEQGDFLNTIGDVLDVVLGWAEAEIAAGRAQATPEMARALSTRAAIKAAFPKPSA